MTASGRPRLAFVYGSREVMWPGIAHYLFAEKGVIRDTLLRCERLVQKHLNWSLEKVGGADRFPAPYVHEPLLASVQIALTDAWRERGIEPDAIAGRCVGETATEYARGTLSLEDAIEIACRTSHMMSDGRGRGAGRTLRIELDLVEATRLRQSSPVDFSIVADAADGATMFSCRVEAEKRMGDFLRAHRIEHHTIRFEVAPHSPLIEDWKSDLLKPLSGGALGTSTIPYYSASADGQDQGTSYQARLWRSVREPALIGRMLDHLTADGCTVVLEVGGQALLAEMVQRRASAVGKNVASLATMRPNKSPRAVMNETQKAFRRLGVAIRPLHPEKSWFGFARW